MILRRVKNKLTFWGKCFDFFFFFSLAHKLGATLIIVVSFKVNIEKDFSYALRGTTIATNLFRSRGWFCPPFFHGLPHPTPSFSGGLCVLTHSHTHTHTHTHTLALEHTYRHIHTRRKGILSVYKAQMFLTLFHNTCINCVLVNYVMNLCFR